MGHARDASAFCWNRTRVLASPSLLPLTWIARGYGEREIAHAAMLALSWLADCALAAGPARPRASRLRPAGRRLCQLSHAIGRPRVVRRALRARFPLPRLG